jgi:putative membrane protein
MDLTYHWLKALHIVAVIAWMCGMLYLPRLFVYHCNVAPGSEADGLFITMERKLMRLIINPAMIATWVFGLWLAYLINAFDPVNGSWLHAKLGLVLLMQIAHAMMSRYRKVFAKGQRPKSEKYFRFFNEVPTLLMIGIVFLVVFKPF